MSNKHPERIFAGYIFDLDGTVYLGDALLPTAQQTIATLRNHGASVIFLSNNPLQSRAAYADKLTRLGIPATMEDVINSSWVMARWLVQEAAGATLFVIGETPLKDELCENGFPLSENTKQIDFVIASFDRTFDYHKLQIAFDAIRAGARFVATNADPYCPVPGGGLPDAGAVIGAIEGCTGRPVEVVVGKPSPFTVQAILERLQLPAGQCLMVGDRLQTDIRMGKTSGMATAVTLTGVTTRELLAQSEIQPDYVLEQLEDVYRSCLSFRRKF